MRTICLILIGCALLCAIPAVAIPQLPSEFYGTITIDGAPAPVGTVITAEINGQVKGNITITTAGKYGGPGSFDDRLVVTGEDSDVSQLITFSANGRTASQTRTYSPGSAVEQLDLTITGQGTQASSSSGGSSGGSGYSGGSSISPGGQGGVSGTTPEEVTSPASPQVPGGEVAGASTMPSQTTGPLADGGEVSGAAGQAETKTTSDTVPPVTKRAAVPAFLSLGAILGAVLIISKLH